MVSLFAICVLEGRSGLVEYVDRYGIGVVDRCAQVVGELNGTSVIVLLKAVGVSGDRRREKSIKKLKFTGVKNASLLDIIRHSEQILALLVPLILVCVKVIDLCLFAALDRFIS